MTATAPQDAHPAPDASTVVPPVYTPAEALPEGWIRREDHLVWLDLEMTGLEPATDRIIEIAVIVTDAQLDVRIAGPVFAIHQSDAQLDTMDAWNRGTHGKNGLTQRVRASTFSEEEVEARVLEWLRTAVPSGKSPMCGNTIGQDRRFLNKYMPRLENFFHYRNIDVSTLKELAKRWKPSILPGFAKAQKHTALADIHESIDEMRYYREHFLNAPKA